DLLRDSNLMAHILPELLRTINCDQSPDYHPEGTVYNHIRLALEKLPADAAATLPWTVLLHDIGKPDTASVGADGRIHFYAHEKIGAETAEAILERLRFPRKQIDEITFTVRHHMQFKDVPRMRKATLRRLLLRPTFALEREHHRIDCLASHGRLDNLEILDAEQTTLNEKPARIAPLVTGHDLLALGIPGNSAMGELLEDIRDRQLAEEFTTREEALAWAKEKAAQ
ncbi:MAG: HD domain-containing protein, partial [Verrucomicrobiota bacterium]|nr:HD domain-containing protein [Verrucomicrobiota bacterium]